MKIAALFIIYKPHVSDLVTNILQVIETVDLVVLWFNSAVDISLPEQYENKILSVYSEENQFIAAPINNILEYCSLHNFDYLLTMDQDSYWEDFSGFIREIKNMQCDDAIVYSPNINRSIGSLETMIEVDRVITSGSLYNVELTRKLGGFREDYKIYWVDGEFSYWSIINNYKLICLPKFNLLHQFGGHTKRVFGITGANYSFVSYYFLFRNMLWMHREFGVQAVSYKTIFYTMKSYIPGIILCEENKIRKLAHILKAFFHGLFISIKTR